MGKLRYIDGEELLEFEAIRDAAEKLREMANELEMKVLRTKYIPTDDILKLHSFIHGRLERIGDLPYMLNPQTEWKGGERFQVRIPHALLD
jgi:hypothetical protein